MLITYSHSSVVLALYHNLVVGWSMDGKLGSWAKPGPHLAVFWATNGSTFLKVCP